MTVDHPTRCPYCRAVHEAATGVTGAVSPNDGDISMCIQCGRLSIFEDAAPHGTRKPTEHEFKQLLENDEIKLLLAAYKRIKGKRCR